MSRLRARDIPGWLERAASGPAPVAVAPLEYFSIPEVMRQQSWASLTPWNALFYELTGGRR